MSRVHAPEIHQEERIESPLGIGSLTMGDDGYVVMQPGLEGELRLAIDAEGWPVVGEALPDGALIVINLPWQGGHQVLDAPEVL